MRPYEPDAVARLNRVLRNAESRLEIFERRTMPDIVIDMQRDHIAIIHARLIEAEHAETTLDPGPRSA